MRWLDELLPRFDVVKNAIVECAKTVQGAAMARVAPHRLYGAALAWTGSEWQARVGEGASEIAGYGSCAAHALEDFDCVWRGQYPPRRAA
jgi:hypothetical protein